MSLLTFASCRQAAEEKPPQDIAAELRAAKISTPIAILEGPISTIEFYADKEGITIGEDLTNVARKQGILDQFDKAEPYEIFEALTDPSVAMPIEIARNPESGQIKTKRTISYGGEQMRIPSRAMAKLVKARNTTNARTSACFNYIGFQEDFCIPVPGGNGTCDSHVVGNLDKESNGLFDTADTWTNKVCGKVIVGFYRNVNGSWINTHAYLKGNGIWRLRRIYGSRRQLRVFRLYDGGQFMRAATLFINQ
ncbi:hypothetical protein BKI52_40835 [marine bacterium AO1-C]|nr:hypothetical protein BKI52_40835 [marine bacterium AO1-C]